MKIFKDICIYEYVHIYNIYVLISFTFLCNLIIIYKFGILRQTIANIHILEREKERGEK